MKINLIKQNGVLYPLSQEDTDKLDKLSNATYAVNITNLDLATRHELIIVESECKEVLR